MVILLDKRKKPLGFVTEKHARKLMEAKRACIYRTYPFTIIGMDLDARNFTDIKTYRIKIDPGSVYTGITIIGNKDNKVYFYMQIEHRGAQIHANMKTRAETRRNRRKRETWYRRSKWGNKSKGNKKQSYDSPRPDGWLPPCEESIADNVITWVRRLLRLLPITECSFEAVRIDSQKMDNPEIQGKEYQQGTLAGCELKEYLLEKYQHTCQYCGGASGDKVMEREHMLPKSRGGSDKLSNANLACRKCNQKKGAQTVEEWLAELQKKKKPSELDEKRIECLKRVLEHKTNGLSSRYSAWVTVLRKRIEKELFSMFGKVECASGSTTKYNRIRLGLPKDHHYDALCVGSVPADGYKDLTDGYVLYRILRRKPRPTSSRSGMNAFCG